MMLQNKIAVFLSCIWLLMAKAMSSFTAQTLPNESGFPVLDTAGHPLRCGVKYFIKPAFTDIAGDLTLTRRNGVPCPLYVGQEQRGSGQRGFPVTFTPYFERENIVREGRDLKVVFREFRASCTESSTQWRVGESDGVTGRRLIITGYDDGATGYFRIDKRKDFQSVYNLGWCPSDIPTRGRPRCGSAGILIINGVRLLALDGPAFPFQFERACDEK